YFVIASKTLETFCVCIELHNLQTVLTRSGSGLSSARKTAAFCVQQEAPIDPRKAAMCFPRRPEPKGEGVTGLLVAAKWYHKVLYYFRV
ncbi:MAG: hypothetical protein AAGF97_16265, partial [Planctomycetota bacterium]